tara:strand:+ start:1681 stop:2844 length:1164 start_codon:yes stop_codon:yes gene_type:complete
MKFIGQYIQSLIARFRNDVYLEDISTGTIASGSNLGLDSNNKIVKATVSASDVDLTADVTGVLPSANLDSDTSHLSVAQTFTGAKTFGTTTKLLFRDANSYIHSPTANDLKISATDITLDAAGPVYLDAGAANAITFQEAGTTIADISAHHNATYLQMYENEGASTDDYLQIKTAAAGATTITTVDAAGTDADLNFAIDGTFSVASTGIDIATDGTITNATWQGNAIASAYLDADTAHYSAQKQLTYYHFQDDINTDKIYIGLQESDAESATATNKQLPILAPVAGKLLKIFLRANTNISSKTLTWRLETVDTSTNTSSAPSGTFGTQSGAGPTNQTMATYDFTSSLDAGSNVIAAGDTVQISVQADSDPGGNIKYYVTCLWEWDLS